MLSKQNLIMMLTIIAVVLAIFLSPVVLKEYYNDYDVNHFAVDRPADKKEQSISGENGSVLYFGTADNGYADGIREWAGYRKRAFIELSDLREAAAAVCGKDICLLVDGELFGDQTEAYVTALTQYVRQGGVVIFYRMPTYETVQNSYELQNLLGIQRLRGEAVKLKEIRLYGGFLLGGETHYSFEGTTDGELADMQREVPWYDVSSRTKTYMAGFLSDGEKAALGLNNEDFPAIIWRSNLGAGSVFAVNGDYMQDAALGLLDAMLYEAQEYSLYPVVNAQNLSITGFPDLSEENEQKMAEIYGMTAEQLCRDILWPTFVAAADRGGWRITAFLSAKQNDAAFGETKVSNLIDYLKYFNEEKAEAGVSLGRIDSSDLRASLAGERDLLAKLRLRYRFAAGYVRGENREKLTALSDENGIGEFFGDVCTVVGEYEKGSPVLSWFNENITLQNATADAYRHSYRDSLRLKSVETALGYSNVQVDVYQVLNPRDEKDHWENLAAKMAAYIDTYWKPFWAFEKTTISESDARVREYLNGSVVSEKSEDRITVKTEGFSSDAFLLLRTHGEKPVSMTGGSFRQVEKNAYLLTLTEQTASITLKGETELYYRGGNG